MTAIIKTVAESTSRSLMAHINLQQAKGSFHSHEQMHSYFNAEASQKSGLAYMTQIYQHFSTNV